MTARARINATAFMVVRQTDTPDTPMKYRRKTVKIDKTTKVSFKSSTSLTEHKLRQKLEIKKKKKKSNKIFTFSTKNKQTHN